MKLQAANDTAYTMDQKKQTTCAVLYNGTKIITQTTTQNYCTVQCCVSKCQNRDQEHAQILYGPF